MNPEIYKLGAEADVSKSGLRDVILGFNDFNNVAGFSADFGYDQCTGWGTADMATFVPAYASGAGLMPTPTPTPTPMPTPKPSPTPTPTTGPMTVTPKVISFGGHKLGTITTVKIVTVVNPVKNSQPLIISGLATTTSQFVLDPATTTCNGGAMTKGKNARSGSFSSQR
jgi:hypothetical protein